MNKKIHNAAPKMTKKTFSFLGAKCFDDVIIEMILHTMSKFYINTVTLSKVNKVSSCDFCKANLPMNLGTSPHFGHN